MMGRVLCGGVAAVLGLFMLAGCAGAERTKLELTSGAMQASHLEDQSNGATAQSGPSEIDGAVGGKTRSGFDWSQPIEAPW
jgi:hypothetical protein